MATNIVEGHIECAICLGNINLKELTCSHLYCKSCLDKALNFQMNGSATINCPKCHKNTANGPLMTTNVLKTSCSANNDLNEVRGKNIRCSPNSSCNYEGCKNEVSKFCFDCTLFLCKGCSITHDISSDHIQATINFNDDNLMEVICDDHKTACQYICCSNQLMCKYCINRNHSNHEYGTIERNVDLLKEALESTFENLELIINLSLSTTESIAESERLFEHVLNNRKLTCLSKYLTLLNSEEKKLRKLFKNLILKNEDDYANVSSKSQLNIEPLKEILQWSGVQLCLLKDEVLKTILTLRTNTLPSSTSCLSEENFLSQQPLGELLVDVEEIGVKELSESTSFKCILPDVDEDDSKETLLNVMQRLLNEAKATNCYTQVEELIRRTSVEKPGRRPKSLSELSEQDAFD